MSLRERMRLGGRSARIQAAVHQAVKDLQDEMERAEITIPLISARAGVTPSTIYRRWGDLAELLSDVAVERLRPVADPEDTGSTRGDIEAFALQYMEEFSSPLGQVLLRDLLANALDANQSCNYTIDHLQLIADRATARGEVAFDVDALIDQVIAPIMYRILFHNGAVTAEFCQSLLRGSSELGRYPQ